ncbi:MAG: cupin domain-containing protein [Clostridiales bacterium]|nr:cupin domain-containing protein [Clostridiales bacterium]
MVKKASDMKVTLREKMRGGDGSAVMKAMLDEGEYNGRARLFSTITLEPGSSIGEHVHDNEEEIFYVIEGIAVYNDDGKDVVMNKGDCCICLGGQKHSLANRGSETLTVVAIILTY